MSDSQDAIHKQYLIAYDLGTGGLKAGLYGTDGSSIQFEYLPYQTNYPNPDWHEQYPQDWWRAVCVATKTLLHTSRIDPCTVVAVAASGHSLVAAPIGNTGELLLNCVPIWSDRRAKEEAAEFFQSVNYEKWYMTTGNGDPPETYSIFKLMWLKKHKPKIFAETKAVLGSKDYINYLLTGRIATDYSYASGSGAFDLMNWRYREDYLSAAGIPQSIFPEPTNSHAIVGTVTQEAAEVCGLHPGTKVICGGVDNSCMALGTTGMGNGRVYTSLGSSAWIAVTANKPILDVHTLPFVFAHVVKGYYTTGVSIFSAGSSYRWARDVFCTDLTGDSFEQMNTLAAESPIGSNGIMFNPSLSGGSSQEPSESLQGSFFGLKLSNSRGDILRSVLEGVALSLRCFCLSVIEPMFESTREMIMCGGGAKSEQWMQIFADIFGQKIVITNVEQDAATLGAAAIAARGAGFWKDYSPLDQLFEEKKTFLPNPLNHERYTVIADNFTLWVKTLGDVHKKLNKEQKSS